jgi:hypothetical protein
MKDRENVANSVKLKLCIYIYIFTFRIRHKTLICRAAPPIRLEGPWASPPKSVRCFSDATEASSVPYHRHARPPSL